MILALVVAFLNLSNGLGILPKVAGLPSTDTAWRVAYFVALLSVGVLYYKGRRAGVKPAEQAPPAAAPTPPETPSILVNYARSDDKDTLSFFNDGQPTAMDVMVGQLKWAENRNISLYAEVPPIPSKHRQVVQMKLHDGGTVRPMSQFLREPALAMAKVIMVVNYGDHTGIRFCREFEVKPNPDGSVTLNPGPVRRQ